MAQAVQEGREDVQDDPRSGQSKKAKDRCKCGQSTNLSALRLKIRCENNSRRIEYEKRNSATDCKGRFGNEKKFRKNGASNLDT